MTIHTSKLWISDLDETIATILPELDKLTNHSVLITGGTGLICSAVIDVLIRWNETHDEKISIIAAGRNREKVLLRFAPYCKENWFLFIPYDACSTHDSQNILHNTFCDYIINGASNASPNKIIKEPVETMLSNFMGMKYLLDYAKEKYVKQTLYISTSEVYGKKDSEMPNKSNDYGGIDILNSRNSYSIGKCAAETLCASYHDEYGVNSSIIRPGHIYGPTASEADNRVSSVWAHNAAKGKNIIMKSDGMQLRSYCYCLDAASAILKVLLEGESVKAYNISNPDSVISIKRMAEILVNAAGVSLRIEMPTDNEKKAFNPMKNSSLDATELYTLGWKGLFDAERGLKHTIQILRESGKSRNFMGTLL